MNLIFLLYGFLNITFSIGWYIFTKRWIQHKKKHEELDGYDKGTIIPRDWVIIICSAALGIGYFFKFLASLL